MKDLIAQLEAAAKTLAAEKFRTSHLDGAQAFIRQAAQLLGYHAEIAAKQPPAAPAK